METNSLTAGFDPCALLRKFDLEAPYARAISADELRGLPIDPVRLHGEFLLQGDEVMVERLGGDLASLAAAERDAEPCPPLPPCPDGGGLPEQPEASRGDAIGSKPVEVEASAANEDVTQQMVVDDDDSH